MPHMQSGRIGRYEGSYREIKQLPLAKLPGPHAAPAHDEDKGRQHE